MQDLYLTLENGTVFKGKGFGCVAELTMGDVVFTTAMTGYLEALTDPGVYGQILVQTFPLSGNYGVIPADFQSDFGPKAYIVKHWCQEPSNFRSEGVLDAFLKQRGIVGLCGIDTRQLTKTLRQHGSMKGVIAAQPKTDAASLKALQGYTVATPVQAVTPKAVASYPVKNPVANLAVWDFGTQSYLINALNTLGCNVTVYPATAKAADILADKPQGILLTDGPGDPAQNPQLIKEITALCSAKLPIFGISLGHQLLALAKGGNTKKLHSGHHGGQPAKCTASGKIYTTSQSHCYVVDEAALPKDATISFVNVNDGSCEGLIYKDMPASSIQFHPKETGGPYSPAKLLAQFVEQVKKGGR